MSNVIVERTLVSRPLGKRTRLPFRLEARCAECGATCINDVANDDYLSYPVPSSIIPISFRCEPCNHEWEVEMVFDVSLVEYEEEDCAWEDGRSACEKWVDRGFENE